MDRRIQSLAGILVDYSTRIQPKDRVLIESSSAAEPLVRELYIQILKRGGYPHVLFDLPDQDELLYQYGNTDQITTPQTFRKLAYDHFESRIRIASQTNTRSLVGVDPKLVALRQKEALAPIMNVQFQRGSTGELKWVSTAYPTLAYAMEASMGLSEYENFLFSSCFADEQVQDPIARWELIGGKQARIIEHLAGHSKVSIQGSNVDLKLSIKDRTFVNACGRVNMPDGEIFTSPVEDSVEGWVRYTFPAIRSGFVVDDIELKFERGKVVHARAGKNQDFLQQMLQTDDGAKYVGEFAFGLNDQIKRFTGNILFDEKIGGTMHLALGSGYPETGSRNHSSIHWDMICDLREDSEIELDGETIFDHGKFLWV